MKRTVFIGAFVMMVFCSYAKKIFIYRSGGGSEGYAYVDEHHMTGLFRENSHVLSCYDPGSSICRWNDKPYLEVDEDTEFVGNQVLAGNLTGTITIDGRTITWTGNSNGDFEMEVNIPE